MSTTVTTLEYQHTDEIKLLPHVPAVSSFHHVTDYESFGNSVSKYDRKSVHISDMPMTWSNWHNHINWPISIIILVLPLVGTVMTYWVPLQRGTALFSIAYCFQTLLGITAGKCSRSFSNLDKWLTLGFHRQDTTVFGLIHPIELPCL